MSSHMHPTLPEIFEKAALLCVDTQEGYCNPDIKYPRGNQYTKDICERLSIIVPQYRALAVPVIWLRMGGDWFENFLFPNDNGKFYKAHPEKGRDKIITMKSDSGFVADESLKSRFTNAVPRRHPKLHL